MPRKGNSNPDPKGRRRKKDGGAKTPPFSLGIASFFAIPGKTNQNGIANLMPTAFMALFAEN